MSGYFFWEICVEPTANPTSVLTDAANIIRNGFKGTSGELRYLFRVVGENVLGCIVKGPVDGVINKLNQSCGNFIRLCCHPLRLHESYARKIMQIDETLASPPAKPYSLDGDVFLMELSVNYKGKSLEEFSGTLYREAVAAYTLRQQGLQIELFKVVAERRVYAIIKGDADAMDDLSFSFPIMKENGDQVLVKSKAISAFP